MTKKRKRFKACENEFIKNLVNAGISDVWLGISDVANEDTWVDSNGSELDWENWANHEPSNSHSTGEHYGHMRGNGEWNDVREDNDYRVICIYRPDQSQLTQVL